jgi:hypothetical protein
MVAIEFLGVYYGSRAAFWGRKRRFWTKTDRLSIFDSPSVGVGGSRSREIFGDACNSSSWILRCGVPLNITDPKRRVNWSMPRRWKTSWA